MHRTVDFSNHSQRNERSDPVMDEVSDTETIDHEHVDHDPEVTDTETIEQIPEDFEEPHSACQRVFGTTELLEHIISFLPMRKIFTVQSVSKQWQNVIAASPRIEEKVYLRLKTTPKETCDPRLMGWAYWALQRVGLQCPPHSLL